MVLAGGVLAGVVIAYQSTIRQRILPNVEVAGQPVGGLTVAEARQRLEASTRDLTRISVSVTFEGDTWTATASQLGFVYDIDGALQRAFAVGRSGGLAGSLVVDVALARQPANVPVNIQANNERLERWTGDVAAKVDRPAED
ncbi:MAG: peptidoglycan binding domain-containing protein, partial [Chloroflexota bacterium]|nr:peptidoglycan binding domain-containing protein [Chloroflexota bacterium]